ncbi:MAG: hypothetical protein ABSH05_11900, partial [Bryobacteraceae bacterium]
IQIARSGETILVATHGTRIAGQLAPTTGVMLRQAQELRSSIASVIAILPNWAFWSGDMTGVYNASAGENQCSVDWI